jgi:hypothetical protein
MNRRILLSAIGGMAAGLCLVAGCATGPPPEPCPPCPGPGYLTNEQIEQMPLLERPDRPGHCVGNTIRAIDRWLRGDPSPDDYDPCP